MGIIDEIKNDGIKTGTKIQNEEQRKLESILNKMFYCERDIEEETKFINLVMTRGLGVKDRVGLHASAMIFPSFTITQPTGTSSVSRDCFASSIALSIYFSLSNIVIFYQ